MIKKAVEVIFMADIDSEKKDTIIKGAYARLKTTRSKGYKTMDQSSDLIQWLKKQDDVADVTVYGNTDITVKFKDKTQVGILLGRNKTYGSYETKDEDRSAHTIGSYNADNLHPASKSAAVIDPLKDDWPPDSTPDGIKQLLEMADYNVDYIQSDSADLAYFASLDDKEYGIVFMRTHGGMINVDGDDKLHIMARPFFEEFPPDSGYKGVNVFTVFTDVLEQEYAYAYAFNDLFVKEYLNKRKFPNSLFHLLVCHGADPKANDDMIKAFLERGVGCYTGWTKTASSKYGDPAAVEFFRVLCDASTKPANAVKNAVSEIESLGSSPDPETNAILVAHGVPEIQILEQSTLQERSEISVRNSKGKIIQVGFQDMNVAIDFGTKQILDGKHSGIQVVHKVTLKKMKA